MKDFQKYHDIALEIAQKVGDSVMGEFGKNEQLIFKEDKHYGIEEDVRANTMYEEFLREKTPEVALYTEEGEQNLESDLVWVIDPIDGTTNYRVGMPLFVTQIALLYKNDPVVSVIYNPLRKNMFTAQEGKGAFLNTMPISVSEVSDLGLSVFDVANLAKGDYAFSYYDAFHTSVRSIRCFGTTGLSLAFLASGKTDFHINTQSGIYDYVPGVLLVREAGGGAFNQKGDDWKIGDTTLIATNKNLALKVMDIARTT